jgi:hypothetical protein
MEGHSAAEETLDGVLDRWERGKMHVGAMLDECMASGEEDVGLAMFGVGEEEDPLAVTTHLYLQSAPGGYSGLM